MSDVSRADQRRRRLPWRRWNVALHRDIGYLTAALTILYAISGIAVNHTHQWNPSVRIERERVRFSPVSGTTPEVEAHLRSALHLPAPKERFRASPGRLQLFYEGWNVDADLETGEAVIERPRSRFLLRDFNFLHLNQPKGLWTWVADLYALCLLFLAVSGLFILKGRRGLAGRGKWLFAAGLAVPVVFIVVLRYLA